MKKANFFLINNHRTDKKEIDFPLFKLKKNPNTINTTTTTNINIASA